MQVSDIFGDGRGGHNRSFGNIKDQRGSRKMKNFDFTQFVSFDSVLPYQIIYDSIVDIFEISDFEVISINDIESVKKSIFLFFGVDIFLS